MFSRKNSMESSEKKTEKKPEEKAKFSFRKPKQAKATPINKTKYQCFLDDKTGEITENFNLLEKLSKKHGMKL